MQIRVYYEDTDCGGIVYHANFIKFCERARSEAFFALDKSPNVEWCGFVVKGIKADFLAPARLGDLLDIESELLEKKSASITIRQNIFKDGEKIFSMDIRMAYVDVRDMKIKKIPDDMMIPL